MCWRHADAAPTWFRRIPPRAEARRHQFHYFDGELEEEYRFHFRGPDDRLDLAAQNLRMFLQLAEGIDAETWEHHLRRGDYSAWFRGVIKDTDLAAAAESLERAHHVPGDQSRQSILEKIRERYEKRT